jgi:hypothetical protein
MQQVMAANTQYQCLPTSGYHESLPWRFPLMNIRQFPDMMHLKVSFLCLAIFAVALKPRCEENRVII